MSEPLTAIEFPAMGSTSAPGARGFVLGAASAATQIEDGNEQTDWYLWTAPEPEGLGKGLAPLGQAVEGYTRAQDDVALIAAMGLDSYRFSVEWGRVEGARDEVSEEALAHHDALIDGLLAEDIQPMLTVYHFSNPLWVRDFREDCPASGPSDKNLCGWTHPEGVDQIIEELAEHALARRPLRRPGRRLVRVQ